MQRDLVVLGENLIVQEWTHWLLLPSLSKCSQHPNPHRMLRFDETLNFLMGHLVTDFFQ